MAAWRTVVVGSIVGAVMAAAVAVAPSAAAVPICGVGSTSFDGGAGTSGSPYEVSTAAQLALVTNASCTSAYSFIQTANIDLAGVAWSAGALNATYFGNDMTISNLTITTSDPHAGLFWYIDGAVQDLVLSGFSVTGTGRAGALAEMAGVGTSAFFTNVRVVGGSIAGGSSSGGLIGTQSMSSRVLNCSSSATVSATAGAAVGGLVGEMQDSASVMGSSATGDVTGYPVGGLVGYVGASAAIDFGRGSGTVIGASNSSSTMGGLVGDLRGTIRDSSATGSVHSPTPSDVSAGSSRGGLVGVATSGTITRSSGSGDVTGASAVGGLVGNTVTSATVTDSYAQGTVTAGTGVAGAAGLGTFGTGTWAITNSYARGAVVGTNRNGLASASATATDSYWDSETSGVATAGSGSPKTTAQMQTAATFGTWDGTNTWVVADGAYPALQHPVPSAPASQTFTASLGTTDTKTITITNAAVGTGTRATLTMKGTSLTGALAQRNQFAITANTCTNATTVTANSTCAVTVQYTSATSATARLDVYTNAGVVSTSLTGGLPVVAPDAPTSPSATPGSAQATVSWTAPLVNGGATITTYTVTASPGGTTCTTTSVAPATPATSCSVTGLTNGTAYTFTVTATNSAGTSIASSATTPVTPAASGGGGGGGGGSTTTPTPTPAPTPAPTSDPLAPVVTPATQGLTPGQTVVTQGGVSEPTTTTTNPSAGTQTVSGTGWSTSIGGTAGGGTSTTVAPSGGVTVPPGGLLSVGGSGYQPGTTVQVYGLDPTVLLGSLTVGADGSFRGVVPIATSAAAGGQVLQVNGYASPSSVRSVSLGYVVSRARTTAQVSTAVFFEYRSAQLTRNSRRALKALVERVPSASQPASIAVGWLRSTGATAFDRALARARATHVAAYLKRLGLSGPVVATTKEVDVRNQARYRRVNVTVRFVD